MHIPKGDSRSVELLGFDEALAASGKSGAYDAERWLYVPDFYTEYRYILGTRGKDPLICVGINPSTAAPDDLDNTLKSVSRIAASNGFDSWIMFNVYAQRATDPNDMDRSLNASLHRENMRAFRHVLSGVDPARHPAVWAAWGTIITKRPYLKECVSDMVKIAGEFSASWYCAGRCSKDGHPHHPLYLKKDEEIRAFDIGAYMQTL